MAGPEPLVLHCILIAIAEALAQGLDGILRQHQHRFHSTDRLRCIEYVLDQRTTTERMQYLRRGRAHARPFPRSQNNNPETISIHDQQKAVASIEPTATNTHPGLLKLLGTGTYAFDCRGSLIAASASDSPLGRYMAGGLGFEPRLADPNPAVLPLDDPPP